MDEMNITYFSSSLSQTFFLAWRWKMLFLHCVLQCFMFFSEMVWSIELPFSSRKNLTFVRAETGKFLHLPWMTKDVWNMLTIWSAVSFILVVLSRSKTCDNALENHGRNEERTFFIFMSTNEERTFSPSVNNNETCNVATSSNQATSSRIQHHPTHFTWRYYTPPTPPTPLL